MRYSLRLLFTFSLALLFTGLPASSPVAASPRILTGFPTLKQQHSLTCESSAASMGTRGRIAESQIMGIMPRNPNPNLGFRGNPDGVQGTKLIDYGVYAAPVQRVLLQYGYRSDLLMYATDRQLRAYIDRGWPVVVWITYQLRRETPRIEWASGSQFFLVPREHALLVVGYDGSSFIANDPWVAQRFRYGLRDFNRSWGYFADMALAIQPCPTPPPVTQLRKRSVSLAGVTWTWNAAPNASSYRLKVIQHGDGDQTVFFGTQSSLRFTFTTVVPGDTYEIVVRAISWCGGLSGAQRVWTYVPATLATPTATPAEGGVSPTPTSTPARTPSPASTPGSAPSPSPTAKR